MKPGDLVFCNVDDCISLYAHDNHKHIVWKKREPGIVIQIRDSNIAKILTQYGIIEVYFEFICK